MLDTHVVWLPPSWTYEARVVMLCAYIGSQADPCSCTDPISVEAGDPFRLRLVEYPSSTSKITSGTVMNVSAVLEDKYGNTVRRYWRGQSVREGLRGVPLFGPTYSEGVGNVEHMGLWIERGAGPISFQVSDDSSPALGFPILPDTAPQLVVFAGVATKLTVTSRPPHSVTAGEEFSYAVGAVDVYGNFVTDDLAGPGQSSSFSLAFSLDIGIVSETEFSRNNGLVNGYFSGNHVHYKAEQIQIRVDVADSELGIEGVVLPPVHIVHGPASHLVIVQPTGAIVVGLDVDFPTITVRVVDQWNNVITNSASGFEVATWGTFGQIVSPNGDVVTFTEGERTGEADIEGLRWLPHPNFLERQVVSVAAKGVATLTGIAVSPGYSFNGWFYFKEAFKGPFVEATGSFSIQINDNGAVELIVGGEVCTSTSGTADISDLLNDWHVLSVSISENYAQCYLTIDDYTFEGVVKANARQGKPLDVVIGGTSFSGNMDIMNIQVFDDSVADSTLHRFEDPVWDMTPGLIGLIPGGFSSSWAVHPAGSSGVTSPAASGCWYDAGFSDKWCMGSFEVVCESAGIGSATRSVTTARDETRLSVPAITRAGVTFVIKVSIFNYDGQLDVSNDRRVSLIVDHDGDGFYLSSEQEEALFLLEGTTGSNGYFEFAVFFKDVHFHRIRAYATLSTSAAQTTDTRHGLPSHFAIDASSRDQTVQAGSVFYFPVRTTDSFGNVASEWSQRCIFQAFDHTCEDWGSPLVISNLAELQALGRFGNNVGAWFKAPGTVDTNGNFRYDPMQTDDISAFFQEAIPLSFATLSDPADDCVFFRVAQTHMQDESSLQIVTGKCADHLDAPSWCSRVLLSFSDQDLCFNRYGGVTTESGAVRISAITASEKQSIAGSRTGILEYGMAVIGGLEATFAEVVDVTLEAVGRFGLPLTPPPNDPDGAHAVVNIKAGAPTQLHCERFVPLSSTITWVQGTSATILVAISRSVCSPQTSMGTTTTRSNTTLWLVRFPSLLSQGLHKL